MLPKIFLFGTGITNSTKEEVLEYIENSLSKKEKKYFIVTPNPELVVIAHKNPQYLSVLNQARISLCDGIGLFTASRFLGKSIKERITGVDFIDLLCKRFAKKPITVGFLGGKPAVAKKTAECLRRKYPDLKIVFVAEEWSQDGFTAPQNESRSMNYELREIERDKKIHDSRFMIHDSIDVLFVAFGSPKQELWIHENLEQLPARVVMGVGGAFDFISETVPRAPRLVQRIGLEWLFRLILQPWRVKRQWALLEFLFLVIMERLRVRKWELRGS